MPSAIKSKTAVAIAVGMSQIATGRDGDCLGAVLGSCIGATLYHPGLKIGAMGHIVLPGREGREGPPGKFADTAIVFMLEKLTEAGAGRGGIVAKLAGGASMFGKANVIKIGEQNLAAVKESLDKLGIRVAAQHVGGGKGRRVTFHISDGALDVQIVGADVETI